MKKIIITSCLGVLAGIAFGQTNTFPTTGNAGIGTITPMTGTNNGGLQISKGNHSTIILGDPSSGYGGFIQTTDHLHRVFIGANLYDDVTNSWKNVQSTKGGAGISIFADEGGFGTEIAFYAKPSTSLIKLLVVKGNGDVGIGTNTPTEKLSVKGKIRAQEIKVEAAGVNWPDYVFDSSYKLMPLETVKNFINLNRQLPEVPSAKEVEEKGLELGQNQALLLKKIEELTLYIIEQDTQMKEYRQELTQIKSEINLLKSSRKNK